ncbi:MAG: GTPase [Candidatus Latescibacterota bacterium]
MPTNVTPEFKKAKEAYKDAREPAERLACLKEMLRTIPKHKGTEHLQADIKTRIKELTEELAGPKKGGGRTGPVHTVQPEGTAQVALVGPPNSGKSSLHATLTGSHAETGPYPYTTHAPLPGMLPHEDIHFQLIDLPPISTSFMEPWMPNAIQQARAVILVVDLATPGCVENVAEIIHRLEDKRISLVDDWNGCLANGYVDATGGAGPAHNSTRDNAEDDTEDPFHLFLPTLIAANKCDVKRDPDEIDILEELIGKRYPAIFLSVQTGEGIDRIGSLLFKGLAVVRVYTKAPGRPPDMDRPFTVFRGDTVLDVARLVHRDIAKSFKFARIWGSAKFDGQQVGRGHVVADGDIVELHS